MAQSNKALGIGMATDLQLTMLALGINGALATWKDTEKNSGIPMGAPTLTISNRLPSNQARSYKVNIKLAIPVLAGVGLNDDGYTADPKVGHQNLFTADFIFSDKATADERAALKGYVKDLFSDATFLSDVVDTLALSFDATVESH